MTLAEARTRTRLLCGLTTVDMWTTDLDSFIAQAEVDIWVELLETNPNLATLRDTVTIPANAETFALSVANLPSLGSGRTVHKVTLHAEKGAATDTTMTRVSATEYLIDCTGSGAVLERGQHGASAWRILCQGNSLRFYPPDAQTRVLVVAYTREPKPQTDPIKAILADFPDGIAHECDELVCLQAAADALAAWGLDNSWQAARLEEQVKRRMARMRLLQQQESGGMIGGKWPLA